MKNPDELKQAVAAAAIAHVPAGCVVGVGTGSTANCFIAELARIAARIPGAVASSEATARQLTAAGVPVLDLNDVTELPVYVDGADEIDGSLSMIKGGGGFEYERFLLRVDGKVPNSRYETKKAV